jgi:transcriptional regulator with XRE-family HTH domain
MSSMNTHLKPLESIDAELAQRLLRDADFRRRFIRFWAQNEVASEIRSLRKARGLRQAQVAKLAETGQSAISRIEKADYDGWSYKTLISIAEALKARLRIRFERIEDVISSYEAGSHGTNPQTLSESEPTTDAADLAERTDDDGTLDHLTLERGESSADALAHYMRM